MSHNRVLIFDLDGTLAETRFDIAASADHALAAVGLPTIPSELVTTYVGEGAGKLIERCLGPRQDLHGAALSAWTAHYSAHLMDTTRLYPGVAEVLARLPRPLAVLSNKPEAMTRRIVDALGISQFFEATLGGDSLPERKPHPSGVTFILRATRTASAVLVGDSIVDADTAKAARIPFWGAAYGFIGRPRLAEAGADAIFDSFTEIERLAGPAPHR